MAEYLEPMVPVPYRIAKRRQETRDVFTFELKPVGEARPFVFAPGQFNMLYAFGIGEVPISISGASADGLVHTIRALGPVTNGLAALKRDHCVAVRGPFGRGWPMTEAEGKDVVIAAGGLGMAPLRSALLGLLRQPERYGRVSLLYGARQASDLLFLEELEQWRRSGRIDVHISVDQASREWHGTVGFVTQLVRRAQFRPEQTIAMLCGPEVMMRTTTLELEAHGLPPERIYLSMERNMKCALRSCGHCQFGPHFICADGPVYPYAKIESWLRIRGL